MGTVETINCPNQVCEGSLDLYVSYEGTPKIENQTCGCRLVIECDDGRYHVEHRCDWEADELTPAQEYERKLDAEGRL